jgi:FcoT-like thioesterase domain
MTNILTDNQQGSHFPAVLQEAGQGRLAEPPLLARVLRPYKPHCRYLQSATIKFKPGQSGARHPSCIGEFEIPESCYIDSTGHFNSVEFNICYNQLFYYAIAKLVADGSMPIFRGWTLDDFWSRQLPDILIIDFRSTFRRAMRGQTFAGELEIVGIDERKRGAGMPPLIFIDTVCRYWDAGGGYCHGEVKMGITNPPERPR